VERSGCGVIESNGKGHPTTCLCKHRERAGVQLQPIRYPALDGGVQLAPR
jgi:hypothetical protein